MRDFGLVALGSSVGTAVPLVLGTPPEWGTVVVLAVAGFASLLLSHVRLAP